MGDGAADSTSKGESRVQSQTGRVSGVGGLGLLDHGVNLGSHCELRERIEGRFDLVSIRRISQGERERRGPNEGRRGGLRLVVMI